MKIAVIGESCKDIFIFGDSERICPESCAQVFVASSQMCNDGMAANTYRNVKSILDRKYRQDKDEVDLVTNQSTREYITKTRYVIERTNTTLLRVDVGDKNYGNISEQHFPINYKNYDAIILSDYNKGFLSIKDIEMISSINQNVFLDTKKILGDWCKNIKFIKVNQEEYDRSLNYIQSNPEIKDKLLITKGSQGVQYKNDIFPVKKVLVRGVSGAGDSWMAGFCISYLKEKDLIKAIKYANKVATITVQKNGVSVPFEN